MTEHRPYRTRTSVLFAADAPKAVLLRRETLLSAAVTLADFREATFQQVRAPASAMRW